MSEIGHGIPREFLIVAGIIGIVLVAGMITGGDSGTIKIATDNPKTDIETDGPFTVETETPKEDETSTETDLSVGTTGIVYNVNDLPDTLEILERSNCRITNLKVQNNEISFCIENNGIAHTKIRKLSIKDSCGTSIQFFKDIKIDGGKRECFITKDLSKCDGIEYPVKNIKFKIL